MYAVRSLEVEQTRSSVRIESVDARDSPTPHVPSTDVEVSVLIFLNGTVMYNGIGLTTPRGRFVFSLLLKLLYLKHFNYYQWN